MQLPETSPADLQDREQHGCGGAGAEEQAIQPVNEEEGGAHATGATAGRQDAHLQGFAVNVSKMQAAVDTHCDTHSALTGNAVCAGAVRAGASAGAAAVCPAV